MFKKYVGFALIILVINLFFGAYAFAATSAEKEAKYAEKIKANIAKLGAGESARIEVKLKDGTRIKGYVSQINESSFFVVDKIGNATEIPYPNAKQVKGNNLSTGVKIVIAVAIIAVIGVVGSILFAQ